MSMNEATATIDGTLNLGNAEAKAVGVDTAIRRHGDKSIWGIFIALCIISIIELYSASSREVASAGIYGPILRHMVMLVAGVAIVWSLEKIHYKRLFGFAYIFAFISFLMMVYVMFFGDIINGARRSFTICSISIQPSEFLKLSAVLVIARVMACSQKHKIRGVENRGLIISALIVLLFGGVLYPQGLTNTILLMGISAAMMLIGGTEIKKLALVLLIYGCLGGMAHFGKAYIKEHSAPQNTEQTSQNTTIDRTDLRNGRLKAWNPFRAKYNDDINANNRQEMYSYMAQANGGVIGVFPGNSRETARLPLAFSDYIYAIIIEDLGFVGGILLMALYLCLLIRALQIARKCHRAFPVLLVMGMAIMIVLQALFHMAITTGAFPVSGQPLPLISKGGTSILITSIAFGAMLSVSRSAVQNGTRKEVKEELNDLPEELHAENPVQL